MITHIEKKIDKSRRTIIAVYIIGSIIFFFLFWLLK